MIKNIEIDEKVLTKLKMLSTSEGISVKALIEEAVSHYVDHKEKQLLKGLSSEEKEDLRLLQLMEQSDRTEVASRGEIMNHFD